MGTTTHIEANVPTGRNFGAFSAADACGPTYSYDSNTRLVPEKKDDICRRNVPSPDEWDAVALTFAEPVRPTAFARRIEYPRLGVV